MSIDPVSRYRRIAELSRAICATCVPPFHCCAPVGCGQAKVWARSVYGVDLAYTSDNPVSTMPYLTKHGCTVAPEHRPLCSLWLCPEGERKATDEYWALKAAITEIEVNNYSERLEEETYAKNRDAIKAHD